MAVIWSNGWSESTDEFQKEPERQKKKFQNDSDVVVGFRFKIRVVIEDSDQAEKSTK